MSGINRYLIHFFSMKHLRRAKHFNELQAKPRKPSFFSRHSFVIGTGFFIVMMVLLIGGFFFPQLRATWNNTFHLAPVEVHNASVETPFSDVAPGSSYFEAASFFKSRGIIRGYEDGTFRPEKTMNRAEFLKLILDTLHIYPSSIGYSKCFRDVRDQWFAPNICYAAARGWVGGYPDKTFHPDESINYGAAVKVLSEAFQVDKEKFLDTSMNPNIPLTRGALVEVFYKVYKQSNYAL